MELSSRKFPLFYLKYFDINSKHLVCILKSLEQTQEKIWDIALKIPLKELRWNTEKYLLNAKGNKKIGAKKKKTVETEPNSKIHLYQGKYIVWTGKDADQKAEIVRLDLKVRNCRVLSTRHTLNADTHTHRRLKVTGWREINTQIEIRSGHINLRQNRLCEYHWKQRRRLYCDKRVDVCVTGNSFHITQTCSKYLGLELWANG